MWVFCGFFFWWAVGWCFCGVGCWVCGWCCFCFLLGFWVWWGCGVGVFGGLWVVCVGACGGGVGLGVVGGGGFVVGWRLLDICGFVRGVGQAGDRVGFANVDVAVGVGQTQ
ncbi:hypothetical protein RA264_27785, partial [Pseudomonas syringae pv. tagetis]|uniref:hypothetical protein n=1 Tax=Pseudomonas syringae group genomosp. 7 TaxID=251699 RepID=UPI00376FFDD3